jgi:Zinc knuckle
MSKRSDAVTNHTTPSESVAFVTTVQEGNQSTRSTKAKFKDHITCFKCGEKGHYKSECTSKAQESSNKSLEGTTLAHSGTDISKTWVLLDNQC